VTEGIILYGPPAAGKDTVTAALHRVDSRYSLFQRVKVGGGRTTGYRMMTLTEAERMRTAGEILWENCRYSALYIVDRPALASRLRTGVPILHLGQPESIDAIRNGIAAEWLVVSLWCPRDVAEARISARGTGDSDERLRAWDETPAIDRVDVLIDTSRTSPSDSARTIHDRLTAARGG
jgi:guanylate kinase